MNSPESIDQVDAVEEARPQFTARPGFLPRAVSAAGLILMVFASPAGSGQGVPPTPPAPAISIDAIFAPPPELAGDFGSYRSPLKFDDGRLVRSAAEWSQRRVEIERYWNDKLGHWPALLEQPGFAVLRSEEREGILHQRVRLEIARGRFEEGWYLVPRAASARSGADSRGFPAVLVPFYDPETSIGLKGKLRDFALQLARRGFVTLSIGSPGGDARKPDPGPGEARSWQPLSFLAYVAANAHTCLARQPEVDARRIGIVGHSYGGKWALFAGAFHEKFACVVVSDPGIVWDEARPNVNYWEPWYLGRDSHATRLPGVITPERPRTGAYRGLIAEGRDLTDLHALIAPRPFLVSGGAEDPPERWRALNHLAAVNRLLGVSNRVAMTNRATHDPTPESNEQIYAFFERFLRPAAASGPSSRAGNSIAPGASEDHPNPGARR